MSTALLVPGEMRWLSPIGTSNVDLTPLAIILSYLMDYTKEIKRLGMRLQTALLNLADRLIVLALIRLDLTRIRLEFV